MNQFTEYIYGVRFLTAVVLMLMTPSCGDDEAFSETTVSTGYRVTSSSLFIEAGQSIAYRDASVGAERWSWDFEGGDPATSADFAPRVNYPEAGSFNTILFTYFEDGSRRRFSLRPQVMPRIVPDFTVASRQSPAEVPVTFLNRTDGVGEVPAVLTASDTTVTYAWAFPGGTPATSTASNPSVVYSATGSFDVSLTVARPLTGSEETITKTGFVNIE